MTIAFDFFKDFSLHRLSRLYSDMHHPLFDDSVEQFHCQQGNQNDGKTNRCFFLTNLDQVYYGEVLCEEEHGDGKDQIDCDSYRQGLIPKERLFPWQTPIKNGSQQSIDYV